MFNVVDNTPLVKPEPGWDNFAGLKESFDEHNEVYIPPGVYEVSDILKPKGLVVAPGVTFKATTAKAHMLESAGDLQIEGLELDGNGLVDTPAFWGLGDVVRLVGGHVKGSLLHPMRTAGLKKLYIEGGYTFGSHTANEDLYCDNSPLLELVRMVDSEVVFSGIFYVPAIVETIRSKHNNGNRMGFESKGADVRWLGSEAKNNGQYFEVSLVNGDHKVTDIELEGDGTITGLEVVGGSCEVEGGHADGCFNTFQCSDSNDIGRVTNFTIKGFESSAPTQRHVDSRAANNEFERNAFVGGTGYQVVCTNPIDVVARKNAFDGVGVAKKAVWCDLAPGHVMERLDVIDNDFSQFNEPLAYLRNYVMVTGEGSDPATEVKSVTSLGNTRDNSGQAWFGTTGTVIVNENIESN